MLYYRGRKERFYLTTHSTHFIYSYVTLDIWTTKIAIEGKFCNNYMDYSFLLAARILLHALLQRKEGNVLFNDTLNTFYLQLYGIGHLVNDHKDNIEETFGNNEISF